MNNKPEIACVIFLTGYQLFLFKGCRWFSGSFWPSWSTWTSCKFHHIITESASFATFVAVVTCVFPPTGLRRAERFQRLKCEFIFIRDATCYTLFHPVFIYLFFFFRQGVQGQKGDPGLFGLPGPPVCLSGVSAGVSKHNTAAL